MTTRPSPSVFSSVAWTVATVTAMRALIGLRVGDLIQTAGYHAAGDRGAMLYRVVAAGTGTVDGGSVIALDASSLQAQAVLGAYPTPFHFGAHGDGITDDLAAVDAWRAYVKARTGTVSGLSGPLTMCDLGGGHFGMSAPITLDFARGSVILNGTFTAIGTGWTATDFMLTISTAYARIEDVKIFCARKCSGMQITGGRTKPTRCEVYEYIGHGILVPDTSGPEVWIDQCIIGELDSTFNPVLFADNAAYVGTGVEIRKSDCKVTNTTIRWTRCCYRATGGMQDIKNCHFYNGGDNTRNNGQIIDWTAGSGGELSIDGLYHDNGYSNFYSDRVNINNIAIICDSADMVPRTILNFYANQVSQPARCNIRGVEIREWSTGASLIDFVDYGGNTWAPTYATIETFLTDFIEHNRQNFSLEFNSTAVMISTEAHENREFLMLSGGSATRLGFADRNTTTTGMPYVGATGQNLIMGAPNGAIQMNTAHQVFKAATAPVTAVTDGMVYYDTATNKFRGRAGGAWVDLH